LRVLSEAEGDYGFRQREAKAAYQYARRPAAAGGGFGGGVSGAPAASDALGSESLDRFYESRGRGVAYYDAAQDKQVVAANCIVVGRKTLFRRGEQWVDSSVTEEEQKAAKRIERFSREYFDLVQRHGKHVAQYLAIEGPVCVKLDGRVYSW
jgi:hypothetical protein